MIKRILNLAFLAVLTLKAFPQGAPACPSISPTATPPSFCQGNCTNLAATVVSNQQTTSYSVSSIPYSPYPYSGGTGVSVGTDDVWSPVVNLGFTFCYFGVAHTQAVIGSNGHLTFDLTYASGYDSYPVTTALPSTANMPANTINAVFRDIDPSVSGSCKYYTTGTAPCRALVIYWNNIALYSCGTPHSTFQLVLYENTNYIDVYIQNSSGTCSWQSGNGIVGLLNPAGNVAVCPPGRNCAPFTATNEAWRFTPTGAASYNVTWVGPSGTVGTGLGPISVCPTTSTTYTSNMSVTDCNGTVTTYSNTVAVTVTPGPTITVNTPAAICVGGSTTLNASGGTTYSWTPSTGLSATTGASVTANPSSTTTYTVTGSTSGCSGTAVVTVTVTPGPTVTVNSPPAICGGAGGVTLTANGATTYSWTPSTGLSGTTGSSVTASPSSTTTYTVTGTTSGCSGSAAVTVTISPNPTVTVNTPPAICGGGAGTTLTANGATTYSWTPSTGLSGTTGASVTANPSSTTTYTVTGTTSGCTGTAVVTVTISPNPTVTVNSPSICSGATATLTANGATSYSWTPSTGLSGTTGATVTSSATTTTTYTVTGTTNGCSSSATATVTIGPGLSPTVNSATICTGNSTTLTAAGGTTYTWSPATGLSGTTGASVTANPVVTTTYTVTAANGSCSGTVTAVVTVNPLPTVTVNSATICAGQQTATLTANGASTYAWSPGTGLSGTSGTSVTANPGVTTTYTITGTDANTCTNTATSTVVVNPAPTVTVSNGLICNGTSVTLNAGGAASYTWSPGTGLSGTTGSSVTANPAVTTQYTVTAVDVNGCTGSDTTSVTVVNNPTVTVTTGTICAGGSATLTAGGASTYAWSPGTGLSATTGSVVTASPGSTTTYTITGTIGTCTAIATTTVTVNPQPAVTVNSGTICLGQGTANLTANGATSYSWSPGTGLSATSGAIVTASPGSTTVYTVTGTDVGGCSSTATATVLVNTLPSITVNSGLVCTGSSLVLNANGASTYAWSPAGSLSGSTGASVTATPASTTVYTVVGTDVNGCYSSASSTVTVVTNPTVTVNTGTLCLGQGTVTLTANGATTYAWSPGTGLSGTTGASVSATPGTTTIYTVTGTIGTCTAAATTTVTVNPLPNITGASNSPVCVNQTLNLNASNGIAYVWLGPNNFNSNSASASIPGITVAANGVYTVTGTDANGCVNTNTVSVIVNPLPIVTATGATVCLNGTINLGCLPNGAINYSWSGPGGYGSNVQNPSITPATPAMAGNYVVTVTDANGCVNANVAQVAVNSLPVITVNSGTICAGQTTATLTANGGNTYAWSPATGLSSTTGASVSAGPATTTQYTVTGTDINGCQSTATLTVTVNPAPTISITPQNASGCAPVCTTFSNTAGSSGNCSWNFGDGNTDANCVTNHCFTAQGSYVVTLTVTDNIGCTNTGNASVVVYPVPIADFTVNPQPTTILEPSIQFYDGSSGASIASWNWTFGDYGTNSVSTLQNPLHQYGDTGSYNAQLLVISNYGCRDSVTKVVRIDDDYALYVPNAFTPNTDGTNDVFMPIGFGVKDFKLYIFDRWGMQIFFSDDLNKGWDGRMQGRGDDVVQEDVYVWKIEVKTVRNEKKQLAGTVNLLK